MAEGYSIALDPSGIVMDSIDTRQIKGFLNKDGVGFAGNISFFVETAMILTIDNSDDVFSDKDGQFSFVINSAYDDYHHSSGVDPLVEKKVQVCYIADGQGLLARTELNVIIKPTPI